MIKLKNDKDKTPCRTTSNEKDEAKIYTLQFASIQLYCIESKSSNFTHYNLRSETNYLYKTMRTTVCLISLPLSKVKPPKDYQN